ncbi:MAG: serine/threonine-protein kinase, partial [Deltaproteobacteria bacterium]
MTDGPDAPDGTVVTPMEFDEVDPREGMELLDGTVVVGKLIARGGMGAVYRAKHVKRNMDVAVKFLDVRSLNVDIAELERRFAAEIQVLEGLKSIHVLRVIDFGHTSDGDAFMVTELLEGGTLEAEIKASGGLTEARTIEVLRETSRALVEAHALGIIHRDIKPANLFVEEVPGGLKQTRVLDFGVARVVRDGES